MTDPMLLERDERPPSEKKPLHKDGKPGAAPSGKRKMLEEQLPLQPEPQADADEEKAPENPT